jgi:hypothetical protein
MLKRRFSEDVLEKLLKYRGIDRMPWEEVDSAFYSKSLPKGDGEIWANMQKERRGLYGGIVCRTKKEAEALLSFSNRNQHANELCVYYSDKLSAIRGCIEIEETIEWLGYDVFSIDNWSLIANGVLCSSEFLRQWKSDLNENFLLDSADNVSKLIKDYKEFAKNDQFVEDIIEEPLGIDAFKIGIVNL